MNAGRLIRSSVLSAFVRRGFKHSCISHDIKPLLMAALSPTMDKGNLVSWNFKEGDLMEAGSTICEIETDKAVVGFDAIDDTLLVKIIKPEGTKDIPLGALIGWVADKGDDISKLEIPSDYIDQTAGPVMTPADVTEEVTKDHVTHDAEHSPEKIRASQAVRAMIAKHHIDPSKLKRSGPRASITKNDVDEYLASAASSPTDEGHTPSKAPYTDIPLSTVRGIVASRLSLSKRTIPHEYCSIDCVTDAVDSRRAQLKDSGVKISVNDFILKATALSLKLVPELNGTCEKDEIVRKTAVDIAVAVSIPDGLITPVLRSADGMSLENISSSVKDLASRARDRKLAPEEFQGSSFTVSNLGMYGVDSFAAVINPPELAILAIGASRPMGCGNGKSEKRMNVTLSYDARAVTHVTASKFLRYFKGFIENPTLLEVGGYRRI